MTDLPRDDPALALASRCLGAQRTVLRLDARARQAEQALALWARRVDIPLLAATRSPHPLARQLRAQLRRATRARHQRARLLAHLSGTRATDARATRVKLSLALLLDPATTEALTRSARHDLRSR